MSLSVLTIFALPNIFLAPCAHQVFLLRRLARFLVVGVLLLKLPSIVRWGGAGRLLLQDEACALYNATAQPRAQGPKEIHGNIRRFLPQFSYDSFFNAPRLNLFPRKWAACFVKRSVKLNKHIRLINKQETRLPKNKSKRDSNFFYNIQMTPWQFNFLQLHAIHIN